MNLSSMVLAILVALGTVDGAAAGETKIGAVTVGDAWARATAPSQQVGAAYLTLSNAGTAADRLIAATSPVAERVELHTHTIDAQGVARMRQVDAIEVEAGAEVALAPGGLHIMLIGLTQPLAPDTTFPLTLRFADAGEVTVEVAVQAVRRGQDGPRHGTH